MAEEEGGVSTAVLIYRLTNVEKELQSLDRKIDTFIQFYPSRDTLELILKPYIDKQKELETEFAKYKDDREKEKSQRALVLYGAILSPVVSAVLALIIGLAVKNG